MQRLMGLRGPARGIRKLGLLTPPEKVAAASPAFAASIFFGATLAAAPAISGKPANSTYANNTDAYGTTGTSRGGLTFGAVSGCTGHDTNGGDGFGYLGGSSAGDRWRLDVPNGAHALKLLAGLSFAALTMAFEIWDGPWSTGTLLLSTPAVSIPAGSHMDIAGNLFADGPSAFAGQVSAPVTITAGFLTLVLKAGGGSYANWFGVDV